MWMTEYIKEVKRQFRDVHGFTPSERSTKDKLVFDNISDGEYPMTIDGKLDHVRIKNGEISCCNYD